MNAQGILLGAQGCLRTVMGIADGRAAYEYFRYPSWAHRLRCVLHAVRIVVRHPGADFVPSLYLCPEV